MNMRILDLAEMIAFLRSWLEPQLPVLKQVPEVFALSPQLEKAYREADLERAMGDPRINM